MSSTRVHRNIIRKHACSYALSFCSVWCEDLKHFKSSSGSFHASLYWGIRFWEMNRNTGYLLNSAEETIAKLCVVLTVPVELLRVSLCHQLGLNVLITETSSSWQECLQVTFERTIIADPPMVRTFLDLLCTVGSCVRIPLRVWLCISLCMWFSVLCTYRPCDCPDIRALLNVKGLCQNSESEQTNEPNPWSNSIEPNPY